MELIKFIQQINDLKPKQISLWVDVISCAYSQNKISISTLVSKHKVSRSVVYKLINNQTRSIKINRINLKVKIKEGYVVGIKTREKQRVELDSKQKKLIEYTLNMLNQTTGKQFKIDNSLYVNSILDRLKEGYKKPDFEKVIYIMSLKWLGTKQEDYLRPQTIFGDKMDSYLNMSVPKEKTNASKLEKINTALQLAKEFDWNKK